MRSLGREVQGPWSFPSLAILMPGRNGIIVQPEGVREGRAEHFLNLTEKTVFIECFKMQELQNSNN